MPETGRRRRYCNQSCRQRAYELRRLANALGLAEQKCELVEAHKVYKRDKWRCGLCRKMVDPRLRHPDPMRVSLDHVIPISKGGSHTYANTQCAHLLCNIQKNNRGAGEQLALI